MLDELKFVRGSIAKNDVISSMAHFIISDGTVRGFNGTLALCAKLPLDITCAPLAEPLIKAIGNCTETINMSMTSAGMLRIHSGKFKVNIPCAETIPSEILPEGERIEFDGQAVLAAFKALFSFVGNDAARPWSNGVLLREGGAFATNNVCLVEYWMGSVFPHLANIPASAVREIIRINEPPVYGQMTETSITFHYNDGRWVRSQLLNTEWPDLKRVLDVESYPIPIDKNLFVALEAIKPFRDELSKVFFQPDAVGTKPSSDDGSSYVLDAFNYEGIYQMDMLALLNGVADTIDFTQYPSPALFFGKNLRGAIVGMRGN